MKAVNLIPADARRGAGAPLRSGGLVYGLLAVLAVLAVMSALYGLSARSVSQREATIEQLNLDAARAQTQTDALKPYSRFTAMSRERTDTVTAIAGQRFDWGLTLREIARVVPGGVELVSIKGARGPAPSGADAAAQGGAAQVTLEGCAGSQAAVGRLLARLRAIRGVERVRLETSTKAEAGSSQSDCRTRRGDALFKLVVVYRTDDAPAAPAAAAAGAPASAGAPATPPAPEQASQAGGVAR